MGKGEFWDEMGVEAWTGVWLTSRLRRYGIGRLRQRSTDKKRQDLAPESVSRSSLEVHEEADGQMGFCKRCRSMPSTRTTT